MKLLIDTNAYSLVVSKQASIIKILEEVQHIYMSSIVIGELLYGFYNGTKFSENYNILVDFLQESYVTVLPVGEVTADYFGRISSQLRKSGKKIPTNDIWIAAHTFEAEATLLTFDKHFQHIADLPLHTVTNP